MLRNFTGRINCSIVTVALGLALAGGGGMSAVHAQSSSDSIKLVVPNAPGSGSDQAGRTLADELSKALGKPVVIDNRPGALGTIGTNLVVKAPPDGNTLLLMGGSAITAAPTLMPTLPYNPLKDLAPIYLFASSPMVLYVGGNQPAKTAAELIAQIRSQPKKHSYGATNSFNYAAMEAFKKDQKLDLNDVQYKGTPQALVDLVSGEITVMLSDISGASALASDGRIRPLAVMSKTRSPDLPNVPTFTEVGYNGPVFELWTGVFAPAGTPAATIASLNATIGKIAQRPDLAEKMKKMGLTLNTSSTPQSFANYIRDETNALQPLLKSVAESATK